MTEKQLIKRCQQGDGKALEYLYERYADRMLGVCYRYVNDRDTARDLLHDGFVTVFTRVSDFRSEGSFEGWLRRVFVNTALGYLRKNGHLHDLRPVDEVYGLQADGVSAMEKMSAAELLETIGRLPACYRTVLNLHAVEGYSYREIAELLNINENTSRSRYARAKAQLQRALEKEEDI